MKQRHPRMPYELLELNISNNAKYVYMALLHFRSRSSKKIKVSLAKVSEITGLKGRQLTNHINTLVKYKIIYRNQNKHGSGEYGCNVYTIMCDESYFAEVPWEIAYDESLSVNTKIGYCIMKRHIDLDKKDFICYMTKSELAEKVGCSANEVDKIKRNLKNTGLIECERNSNRIMLVYEKALEAEISSEIKRVVRSKDKVSQNENHSTSI
jgi:DNA-binding IscR family transcriptional regulator